MNYDFNIMKKRTFCSLQYTFSSAKQAFFYHSIAIAMENMELSVKIFLSTRCVDSVLSNGALAYIT